MVDAPENPRLYGDALAATLRALRKHRRLPQAVVATRLGVSRRTYLELEAGSGRMSFDQLVSFADLTRSDRYALMLAVLLEKPSLAVRSADNKFMTVMAIAADDFEAAVGDRLKDVRPHEMMTTMRDALTRLADALAQRSDEEASLTQRLAEKPADDEGV